MAKTVSDFLLDRLALWGVDIVYGYPGDGINGLLSAFNRADRGGAHAGHVRFVQARHEEMAAFMACGHAKFTGKVGVCMATSGPGAIHLLNGLYDAKLDHVPLVAIVGQASTSAIGGSYQQEVDLPTLFKDVAHEYVHTAMAPEQVRHLVDRAFRTALAERTVTCLILPKNVQELPYEEPPAEHDTLHTSVGWSPPRVVPEAIDLVRAADILNRGERVAMLVGQGARGATDEILATADLLGAGIAKSLLGLHVVPDDYAYVTGAIGLLGTRPSWDMMQRCDTLLMVGSSFPYAEFLPKEGQARGIQIDIDGRNVGLRYPMDVNLVGDARSTLAALLPLLVRKTDRSFQEWLEQGVKAWWQLMAERAHLAANGINPERLFWELSPRLPENAIVTTDSGSAANWLARDVRFRRGMLQSASGGLATMGPAVPYAIAAKFAYPGRVVVACVGDGAMQMNGNAELLTLARHYKEWSDPRCVILVLHNNDLNQVTWEMRAMAGDPKYAASQDLPDFSYAAYAEMVGLRGIRVEGPEDVGAAWEAAFAADRPVVLDAIVDPDVAPLPPHITLQQAKAFGSSLIGGDPHGGGVLKQAIQHMFPALGTKAR